MTKEEAIEVLKEYKTHIDKIYFNTKNSKAIEIVLSIIEKQERVIDLMAKYSSQLGYNIYFKDKKAARQYFENKAKEVE